MSNLEDYRRDLEASRSSLDYKLERVCLRITARAAEIMEQLEVTRVALAERLSVSKPMVTKMLNGNTNFTLRSLVSLADALDCELAVDFAPKGLEYQFVVSPRPEDYANCFAATTRAVGQVSLTPPVIESPYLKDYDEAPHREYLLNAELLGQLGKAA